MIDWTWIAIGSCSILFGSIVIAAWLIGAISFAGSRSRLFLWHMVTMVPRPISTTSTIFGGVFGIATLFAFRSLSAIYLVAVLVISILTESKALEASEWEFLNPVISTSYFFYNTDWAYLTTLTYFVCSAVVSCLDFINVVSGRGMVSSELRNRAELWLWIAAELSGTAAVTVAALYWIFVVGMGCSKDGSCVIGFYSVNAHGVVAALVIIEMALDAYEWVPMHFVFPLAFILSWEIIAGCVYASARTFVYSIQDPKNGAVFAYGFYPFFVALYVVFFFVMLGLNRLLRKVIHPHLYRLMG